MEQRFEQTVEPSAVRCAVYVTSPTVGEIKFTEMCSA